MRRFSLVLLMFISFSFVSTGLKPADGAQKKTGIQTRSTLPSKSSNRTVPKSKVKKETPISIALENRGGKWWVRLNRASSKVEVFTGRIRLQTFPGKGRTRFDVTNLVPKARKNRMTVNAYSTGGTKYSKHFDLSRYGRGEQAKGLKLKTRGKSKQGPIGIERVFLKNNNIQVALKPTNRFDPKIHGKGELVVTYGKTTKTWPIRKVVPLKTRKGSKITSVFDTQVTFEHSDHVTVLFRIGNKISGYKRQYFSPKPGPDGRDRFPGRDMGDAGGSSMRVMSPIRIIEPQGDDQFPPGFGIQIPIRYSFGRGRTAANVVIHMERTHGGYSHRFYSGPPLASHLFPRPPETEAWPTSPEHAYRIVVTADDGRTASSELFSLSPYRLFLERPNGGEQYFTSHSPWRFRWHAEDAFHHVEAVLLKGGVEMRRWTPHINPPDHFLGDEIIISPGQTWRPAGSDYTFRIEGYGRPHGSDAPVIVAVDESDGFFEVVDDWRPPRPPPDCSERTLILVVTPRYGSDPWYKHGTYQIRWCTYDESVTHVNLNLLNQDTGTSHSIRNNAPNSYESSLPPFTGSGGGSLDWTVPEGIPAGDYKFYIRSSDGVYEHISNTVIEIKNWLRPGASPARNETWRTGETRTITWESGGLSGETVDIFLRQWDSGHEYQVADGIPNTGSFPWRVTSEALPEGVTQWEYAFFIIRIEPHFADSEYFHLRDLAPSPDVVAPAR